MAFFVSGATPLFLFIGEIMKLNGKTLAKTAIFSALAFIVSYLEFPIFPQAPFFKLDFSNVFVLIGGFSLGPAYGALILFVKELLCLIKTSTYVGQIANFLMGISFVLLPTILYKYKKGLKLVITSLVIATIIQTLVATLVNRFINFPLYGLTVDVFYSLLWIIIAFNLIKGVAVSIVAVLLYKRIKKVLDF